MQAEKEKMYVAENKTFKEFLFVEISRMGKLFYLKGGNEKRL